jgi:hypothetical protein
LNDEDKHFKSITSANRSGIFWRWIIERDWDQLPGRKKASWNAGRLIHINHLIWKYSGNECRWSPNIDLEDFFSELWFSSAKWLLLQFPISQMPFCSAWNRTKTGTFIPRKAPVHLLPNAGIYLIRNRLQDVYPLESTFHATDLMDNPAR